MPCRTPGREDVAPVQLVRDLAHVGNALCADVVDDRPQREPSTKVLAVSQLRAAIIMSRDQFLIIQVSPPTLFPRRIRAVPPDPGPLVRRVAEKFGPGYSGPL